jgi:outer membrane protein assembly factor BamB
MKTLIVAWGTATAFAASARADWSTYQGNDGHTGYVSTTIPASNLSLLWSDPISTSSLGGLAVGGNGVYVKGPGVSINAVNEQTGEALWSNSYTFGVGTGQVYTTSAPAYANGTVYYQTDNEGDVSLFHGVNAATGAKVFATPYGAQWETYLNPTPYNGVVYTGGGTYGGIYSYNGSTGSQNWFGTEGQYDGWTPATDGKYLYSFTGSGDTVPIYGQFRMINMSTGATTYLVNDTNFQWNGYTMNSAVVLGPNNDAFSINLPGSVYPNYSSAGRLIAFNTQADATHTPHIAWVLSDQYSGQPTLANGVLYADDGGNLVALNELTGATLWSWTPPSGSLTGTMVATDNVIFASTATTTYALDLNTHAPDWSYPVSGNLALSDNTLFVAGANGTLYAFAAQVPEPSTLCLGIVGIALLLCSRRYRSCRV